MSILGLAKKAASASAGFVWKSSGASNVPVLEGGRRMLGSKFKSEDGVGKDTTAKASSQVTATKNGNVDPAMAEKMAALRTRKAELAAQGGKPSTVDKNREANERALDASKFQRVTAGGGADIPDSMVSDIHRIKELNEELVAKIDSGLGGAGGGIAGLLGGGLKSILGKVAGRFGLGGLFGAGAAGVAGGGILGGLRGALSRGATTALGAGRSLLTKLPGVGGLASAGAGLVGKVPSILEAGKGVAGKAGSFIAEKGSSILEAGKGVARKVPGILSGAGTAAMTAGGGILSAAKSKGASLIESGKGLLAKVPGFGAAAASAGAGAAGATAAGAAGKFGLKTIIKNAPILGLLARTGFAVKRAMAGDWTGAAMEVAAGVASTFPGAGTAASLGLDAALIAKDAGAFGGEDQQKKIEEGAQNVNSAADKANNAISKVSATGKPSIQRAMLAGEDDPVSGGLASLQAFVSAAMDEEKGIFVRPARSPFDDQSLFKRNDVQNASFQPSPSEQSKFDRAPGAAIPQTNGQPRQMKRDASTTTQIAAKRDADAKAGNTAAFSQVPTDAFAASPLGNLISRGEGDYNSYNSGTKGVAGGRVGHSGKKDLSSMTLDEIIKSSEEKTGTDKDRVFAAGRYQIITPTLKSSMKKMGLKGDEKFTPEMQDKIFKETLVPQSVNDYLSGKSENKEKAQVDLAKVWRSFADPRTGKTYADAGAGANKASITAAESGKALEDTRTMLAKNNKDSVIGAESKTSVALEQASTQAREAERKKSAPVVVQASVPQAPQVPANAGGAKSEVQGHMATRNDDSSIKRLTDAKMSYGMV